MKQSIVLSVLVFLILLASFFAEYQLGIQPCRLCLYQRYTWYGIFVFLVYGIWYSKAKMALPFLVFLGIAFSSYHLSVIGGLVSERCHHKKPENIEQYRLMIREGIKPICSRNDWAPAGLPAPAWNLIFLGIVVFQLRSGDNKALKI